MEKTLLTYLHTEASYSHRGFHKRYSQDCAWECHNHEIEANSPSHEEQSLHHGWGVAEKESGVPDRNLRC